MAFSRSLVETILPLTNSRGFGRFLRFNYGVGSNRRLPLVVSPQILSMADPFLTRQALYFLSDLDCAIRMYSEETSGFNEGTIDSDDQEIRRAADDCLFEYSLRNPSSRLTTRSEFPPRRTRRESIQVMVKKPGCLDATYLAVDGERVLLSTESRCSFDGIYDSFVTDLHDPDVGFQAIGDGAAAFPFGFDSGEEGIAPLIFKDFPYTFDEVELLSSITPARKILMQWNDGPLAS